MRVLHVVGTISPDAGGPTEAIRMLIHHAPAHYRSEVATLDSPQAPFLAELPFPVHALGALKGGWYSSGLGTWLRANRDRFDGVVVHGLWEYTGMAVRRALAGQVPYVVFAHGMLDPYFKRRFPNKHRKKWLYWVVSEYWNLRGADRVLFTTELERELAAQSFWLRQWRSLVVPLGSETPPANTAGLADAFLDRCPAVQGKRFLLFLGRFHPKKGCDLLVRAFSAVADAAPDVHLVMAGPDPDGWSDELQRMVTQAGLADRVHWPGMLRGDEKWGAFSACDAFILPSHQENFGIAAVEAIASGRPALLTYPVNLAPELVKAGCALSEPDTLQGITSLLQRWLALSVDEQQHMGNTARAVYAQRFGMERNTRAVLEALRPASATPGLSAAAWEPR